MSWALISAECEGKKLSAGIRQKDEIVRHLPGRPALD